MAKAVKAIVLLCLTLLCLFAIVVAVMVPMEMKLVFGHGELRPPHMVPKDATEFEVAGLECWFLPSKKATAKTILVCHGKSGHIGHRIRFVQTLQQVANVVIFDYSGFGNSSGSPTEKQVYQDAHNVWLYLSTTIPAQDLYIYGRSLGGAIATELVHWIQAYHPDQIPAGLILDSTFTTLTDAGKNQNVLYKIILTLLAFLTKCKFETINRIKCIEVPILIIHGKHDDVVPFTQARQLHSAQPLSTLVVLEKGNHKTSYYRSQDVFLESIRSFAGMHNKVV